MARASLFVLLLLAGLAGISGCAYQCTHDRLVPHTDLCYFGPGAADTYQGRGGLSDSWNQYYAPGGCDGLSYQGGKECRDRD
jgi:hypothetical protein